LLSDKGIVSVVLLLDLEALGIDVVKHYLVGIDAGLLGSNLVVCILDSQSNGLDF